MEHPFFVTRESIRRQQRTRPRLSLCMIVRDNEETIEPCLDSIRPWVDEMVVVDTGSTDRTPEIVMNYGAKLSHFAWCDDFSAARNESLRRASGEWLFWMDSDDTIDAENGRKLRQLAYGEHPSQVLGYVMQVHCPGRESWDHDDVTVVDQVKMFRNHPELRFAFRIHEQIIPAIRDLGGEVTWTDIFVVHSGADHTPEGQSRKLQRDLGLLRLDLAERPDHPFVLFNLGMTYAHAGAHKEAVPCLRRCLQMSAPHESHVRKAYALLVSSLQALGKPNEAWRVCEDGLPLLPDDPELLFRKGILAHEMGRLDDAAHSYKEAIGNNNAERHFSSVDAGITSFKARHNLALVYLDMGRPDLAEAQWRHARVEAPGYPPVERGLNQMRERKRRLRECSSDDIVCANTFVPRSR